MLRVAQRRGLRVGLRGALADVGRGQDAEPSAWKRPSGRTRCRCAPSSRSGRAVGAQAVALLRRFRPSRPGVRGISPRPGASVANTADRGAARRSRLAADHHAIAALEAPDRRRRWCRRPRSVDPARRAPSRADVVDVVRVPPSIRMSPAARAATSGDGRSTAGRRHHQKPQTRAAASAWPRVGDRRCADRARGRAAPPRRPSDRGPRTSCPDFIKRRTMFAPVAEADHSICIGGSLQR